MGMGERLGGKIGLVGVVFHVSCVECGWVGIGDSDRGGVGMIAVGDCIEVLRVLRGICRVRLNESEV